MPMSASSPRGKTTSSVSLPTDCDHRRALEDPTRHGRQRSQERAAGLGLAGTSGGTGWRVGAREYARSHLGCAQGARKSMPQPATVRSCVCSRAGTSCRRTMIARTLRPTVTLTEFPWAVISSRLRLASGPVFMVHAVRDPEGPNIDRIQIIKGWLGKDGKAQERIFDVAVSGGRKIGPDGRCKTPVGSTVDVANASYTNTIGATTLSACWRRGPGV